MKRPRVILADDYGPARDVYAQAIAADADVVAEVSDGQAAIEAAKRSTPDIVVLDISMGAINGFAVARWLKQYMPNVAIIFLTMHAESAYIEEAARIGAQGYVLKRNPPAELSRAVQVVFGGGTHYPTDSGTASNSRLPANHD